MSKSLSIDFVSDVSCPWCVIGLKGLERALERIGDVEASIRFQPFELNPDMPPEGQRLAEYAAQKYGSTPEQLSERRAMVRERAAALGFTIALPPGDGRVYNTFDAHRLLHWAGNEGRQRELKLALFEAYFTNCLNPSDHQVLADAAERAGLDRDAAAEVLSSDQFGDQVRKDEALWRSRGINSVPTIIINGRYLISGGQQPEVFEQAIRIASEMSETAPVD